MLATDCRGVPISYNDAEAIQGLERAHEMTLAFDGDAIAAIDRVLAEHPRFAMGHILRAAWLTQAMETRIYEELCKSLRAAEALYDQANERERGHIEALRAWIHGDFSGAVQAWENVLVRHPLDLLALQLVHLTDVLLGDVVGQRDCVARVFALWDESIPGYEFVLGFYSFGLEENRDFMHAEELGRQALAMRPQNPYAVHAVGHVMEMKGRATGGIAFMNHHAPRWAKTNFANHLWWHLSLFHLDLSDYDSVLAIYDNNLRGSDQTGDKYEELDSAALLWRLKLLDIDVGPRWSDLAEKWVPSAKDTLYAFNDVHAMMSFVAANRRDAATELLNANRRYVEHATDANCAMSREMGLPFCLALQDFAEGRYGDCVDRLLPARYRTHRLGGSAAQRDVIGWTLLEAALRARRFQLALALANERCALKPSSPQNWRYVARAFKGLGDRSRHDRAAARAESLLAA
ncbi:MAG: tetratricopeptide repeat protein [Pseudomonadota bacterium]